MDQATPATHQGQTIPTGHKKPAQSARARKRPDANDAAVGQRVRIRRLQMGMSQEKLGAALGVTFQQVQKYENGTNRIGASRMVQIAQALNVPAAYFFADTGETRDMPDDPLRRLAAADAITRELIADIGILSDRGDAVAIKALRITARALTERHRS